MALPLGFAGLCGGLVIAGIGSSLQHPRASSLVAASFGKSARGPLGLYNFAGDIRQSPVSGDPRVAADRHGLAFSRQHHGIHRPRDSHSATGRTASAGRIGTGRRARRRQIKSGKGFGLLFSIGVLDTSTRMGYLLFLPFLLNSRGATQPMIGVGLAVLFIGGALGKATCGWLGEHLGLVWTVITTELATALLIAATVVLLLRRLMAVLPLLGIALNGTSSVLYGTVPDLAPRGDVGRGFALFYTGTIGAGGLAPIAYGAIADHSSRVVSSAHLPQR